MSSNRSDTEQASAYEAMTQQPWDSMRHHMPELAYFGFLVGSATVYLNRFFSEGKPGKGGVQDLKKSRDFINKLISEIENAKRLEGKKENAVDRTTNSDHPR